MSLVAERVSFSYRGRIPVVEDLSLEVDPGDRVALVGPSGHGKTTVAKLLSGFLQPDRGSITVDGERLPRRGARPVQLIWQHPEQSVDPRLTMRKSLTEAGELDFELLHDLGIETEWLERYPGELSGGEIQRFCIARALRVDLRYLIADEITTMLDPLSQAGIWDVILRASDQRGFGVVAVSHDPELVQRVSCRTLEL